MQLHSFSSSPVALSLKEITVTETCDDIASKEISLTSMNSPSFTVELSVSNCIISVRIGVSSSIMENNNSHVYIPITS